MKVQTVANGNVCLVITPENDMEEAILKQLMKQSQNEIIEVRSGVRILEQQVNAGIIIGKMHNSSATFPTTSQGVEDEAQEETL